jgi:hypothetical protein
MERLVSKIPLVNIWKHDNILDYKREQYLGKEEFSAALIDDTYFVIADINEKLKWYSKEEFYPIWKSDIKNHLGRSIGFNLEDFENKYCYLASIWSLKDSKIVVLEKYH